MYCNYSKDKFGNQITFIQPSCITLDKEIAPINELCFLTKQYDTDDPNLRYLASLVEANYTYVLLLNNGWAPQQARAVLPNSLKTELVMTGFVDDWWGEYLVIDKSTGLIDQRIHGKFYTEPNNIDTEKYRIVENGFFPLRCSKGAHPQAQELAIPLRETFINQKIW